MHGIFYANGNTPDKNALGSVNGRKVQGGVSSISASEIGGEQGHDDVIAAIIAISERAKEGRQVVVANTSFFVVNVTHVTSASRGARTSQGKLCLSRVTHRVAEKVLVFRDCHAHKGRENENSGRHARTIALAVTRHAKSQAA